MWILLFKNNNANRICHYLLTSLTSLFEPHSLLLLCSDHGGEMWDDEDFQGGSEAAKRGELRISIPGFRGYQLRTRRVSAPGGTMLILVVYEDNTRILLYYFPSNSNSLQQPLSLTSLMALSAQRSRGGRGIAARKPQKKVVKKRINSLFTGGGRGRGTGLDVRTVL